VNQNTNQIIRNIISTNQYPPVFTGGYLHLTLIYLPLTSNLFTLVKESDKNINMKIRIELDEGLEEQEIIIKAPSLTPEISQLQSIITEATRATKALEFYKGDTRVYLSVEEILFFETDEKGISAHTIDDSYEIRYKLYELEQLLPAYFMRVSKSTILNIKRIFAIDRNLYASSVVSFRDTHKQVYVSRHYYKALIEKMEEKRSLL